MHPPFYTVDHKIDHDIRHHHDSKPKLRRGAPARLDLTPVATGWPPVPLYAGPPEDLEALRNPSGATITVRPRLQVVPPPQRRLRDILGRLLIRMGQRMILENRV